MSSRGGTVTLVYDSPISFSGQYAATALIRDTLADSDWTFQAVEYPALDRTAGTLKRYASTALSFCHGKTKKEGQMLLKKASNHLCPTLKHHALKNPCETGKSVWLPSSR